MDDQKLVMLAEQARKLAVDAVFTQALEESKKEQLNIIAQSAPEKFEEREAAYHMLRALSKIHTQLTVVQNRGEAAKQRVAKAKKDGSSK